MTKLSVVLVMHLQVTDNVASAVAIKTGKLHQLSQEDIIACSWNYGNFGCEGGWITSAFQYIIENGLDSLISYPYETCIMMGTCWCSIEQFCKCTHKNSTVEGRITRYVNITSGNETELEQVVYHKGPVEVNIDANSDFQNYKSGIFSSKTCSKTTLNHAVLIVGMGFDNNVPYWIVKNSWGKDFGESGYIRMLRGAPNECGIASAPELSNRIKFVILNKTF